MAAGALSNDRDGAGRLSPAPNRLAGRAAPQAAPARPTGGRTVAQIRAALPGDCSRVRFDADLSGATRFEVAGVVDEWWPRALLAGMPDVRADIETTMAALRRGEDVDLVPATEVVPNWPHR